MTTSINHPAYQKPFDYNSTPSVRERINNLSRNAFDSIRRQAAAAAHIPLYRIQASLCDFDPRIARKFTRIASIALGMDLAENKTVVIYDPATINKRDAYGHTLLSKAIGENSVTAVKRVLNYGVDVNFTAKHGLLPLTTPLQLAVLLGHTHIAKILLKAGANVHATAEKDGGTAGTPFYLAIKQNNSQLTELLLRYGVNPNDLVVEGRSQFTPLQIAAQHGHLATTKILLKAGSGIDAVTQGSSGCLSSPLYLAAKHGKKDTAKFLVAQGARDRLSDGLFVYIILLRSNSLFNEFLRCKANVNDEAPAGLCGAPISALEASFRLDKPDVTLRLIDAGARIKASYVLRVVGKGWHSVVKKLILLKVNVNEKLNSGTTPLSHAFDQKDKTMVEILMAAGAYTDPSAPYPGDDLEAALRRNHWDDLISKIPTTAKRKPKPQFKPKSDSSNSWWQKNFGQQGPQNNWSKNEYGSSGSSSDPVQGWNRLLQTYKASIKNDNSAPNDKYRQLKQKVFTSDNPEELFELKKGYRLADLKKAQRKILLTLHPDKVPEAYASEASEIFKLYQATFELLDTKLSKSSK